MPTRQLDRFVQHLRRSLLLKDGGGMTDGRLLGQFIERRDEAVFEALVRRHGPMVLGVCQRLLGNAHDAEDAFQATFLVLVRRAASIGKRELVGNWLYAVAYRTALEQRTKTARRRAREKQVTVMPDPAVQPQVIWQELRPLLVTASFEAGDLPRLQPGYVRSFVLRTWGYCKDSGIFTATGDTIEPLPLRLRGEHSTEERGRQIPA